MKKRQYGTANWGPGAVFLAEGDKWTSRPARAVRAALKAFKREWVAPVCWHRRSNNTTSKFMVSGTWSTAGVRGGGGGSGGVGRCARRFIPVSELGETIILTRDHGGPGAAGTSGGHDDR